MSELDRPIEKLLQASAEERRRQAGGPFELHPATRRLLQGEVAREYGAPNPAKAPPRPWFQIWPRLAWSLGTFLVLGMAALITWQSHQSNRNELASSSDRLPATNQPAKDESLVASAPAPLAPVTQAPAPLSSLAAKAEPAPTSSKEFAGARADNSSPPPAGLPLPTAPAPTRSTARGLETDAVKLKTTEKSITLADAAPTRAAPAASPAPASQPKPTIPKTESAALAAAAPSETTFRRNDTLGAPNRGRMAVAPELSQASQAFPFSNQIKTPVTNTLVSFTVEQDGADLKVVDADGSIYTGQVLVAETAPLPDSTAIQSRPYGLAGGAANQSQRSQSQLQSQIMNQNVLNFRVVGTNRSLNQNVVFTGNFVPADETANAQVISNVTAIQNNRVSNQNQLRNQQQQLQEQLPWNNGRISGQAVVGNKQTIAIEASPSQK